MYREQVQFIIGLLMAVEAIIAIGAAYAALQAFAVLSGDALAARPEQVLAVAGFVALANNICFLRLGLYDSRRPSTFLASLERLFLGSLLCFGGVALLLALLSALGKFDNISDWYGFLLMYWFLTTGAVLVERGLANHFFRARGRDLYSSRRILVVGGGPKADYVTKIIAAQRSWGHRIVGFVSADKDSLSVVYGYKRLGELADLEKILLEHSVSELVVVLEQGGIGDLDELFSICRDVGVDVAIVPALFDPSQGMPIRAVTMHSVPFLTINCAPINASGYLYKRILDYVGGVVGFTLFLLMYPAVAFAIRRDSPGPVLYRQERVGVKGRPFTIYKFRTMREGAETEKEGLARDNAMNGAIFKLDHDPRITRVGRFLRRTSLDEFPQFINVLRGEMSLVGTRPPTPDEVAKYSLWQRRRLYMRPGITGLWQVSGRNDVKDFDEIVAMDLKYIDDWRFLRDISILFRTVIVVLTGRGAR